MLRLAEIAVSRKAGKLTTFTSAGGNRGTKTIMGRRGCADATGGYPAALARDAATPTGRHGVTPPDGAGRRCPHWQPAHFGGKMGEGRRRFATQAPFLPLLSVG